MKTGHIQLSAIIALVGAVLLIAGIFLSAHSYNQLHAGSYSCANHFISELGWSKSSNASAYFNWGMISVNLAFMPAMIAMGCSLRTRLGYLAMFFGLATLLAGSGVGIWPMDHLKPHILAALAFFWAYLLTVFLFTLAFCPRWNRNPSKAMVVTGILSCLSAIAFIVYPKQSVIRAMQQAGDFQRPPVWLLAILEWCVLFSALLWGAMAVMVLWRKAARLEM